MRRGILFLTLFILIAAYLLIGGSTLPYRGVWQILLILAMAVVLAIAMKRKGR